MLCIVGGRNEIYCQTGVSGGRVRNDEEKMIYVRYDDAVYNSE